MNLPSSKLGILVLQTGSPEAPTPAAVRKYLREFLGDRRVVDLPPILWRPLLELVILPRRGRASAKRYESVWTSVGSPLLANTRAFASALADALGTMGYAADVAVGCRYGLPSIAQSLETLLSKDPDLLLLFPLFPQYSSAATGSPLAESLRVLARKVVIPECRVIQSYHDQPEYVTAQAEAINAALRRLPQQPERLILSYHGLPVREIEKGDVYQMHCEKTTELLTPLLNIDSRQVLHCYQSRFGRQVWLSPDTAATALELARAGVKDLAVACPGFSADCLETLEEIGVDLRESFCAAGGQALRLVPCLNSMEVWVQGAAQLVHAAAAR